MSRQPMVTNRENCLLRVDQILETAYDERRRAEARKMVCQPSDYDDGLGTWLQHDNRLNMKQTLV
ncbi:hypothetical protein JNB11_07330 [Kocuria palustris]|nr:hypothetical protein [Kocuria palustris]